MAAGALEAREGRRGCMEDARRAGVPASVGLAFESGSAWLHRRVHRALGQRGRRTRVGA